MKKIMVFEWRRAIRSKGFLVAVALGMIVSIADFAVFYGTFFSERKEKILLQAWIGTDYQFVFNGLFYVLLPVLASLPYAGSYYEDIRSGYIKKILIKTSRKGYFIAKSVTSAAIAAVAVFLPLFLNLMICMAVYPMRQPEKLEFLIAGIQDVNLFSRLFFTNGFLYCMAYMILDCLFAGIFALLTICVAEHVESMFSAVTLPFVGYVLYSTVMMEKNDGVLSLMEILNPVQSVVTTGEELAAFFAGSLMVVTVWIYIKGRRKDVL